MRAPAAPFRAAGAPRARPESTWFGVGSGDFGLRIGFSGGFARNFLERTRKRTGGSTDGALRHVPAESRGWAGCEPRGALDRQGQGSDVVRLLSFDWRSVEA